MPAQTVGEVNISGDATQPGPWIQGTDGVICVCNHLTSQKVQKVEGDPFYAGRVPRQVYEEMMTKANLEYDEDVMEFLYGWGFGMKRQAISRAISSSKDKEVTLDNIPEELAQLSDGRTFVCGVEVPHLCSMTARKTEDVYLRIFGRLKNLSERYRRGQCNHCSLSSISRRRP
ncbi:hypothetical protein V3C99_018331 [Haemonchus contortus]|uniref:Protein Wnt n=1 Tax=Haemonchus contortus TaxID=6289 RepID=A0A7I4Z591_HAECO